MAKDPIDCTATAFRAAHCSGCGTNVVAAADFTGASMCLGCRRIAEGIDWESQDPIGEWHPTVGYPRPLEWLSAHEKPAARVGQEFRWACVECRMNGAAENADHADALIRIHDTYACPATVSQRAPREPIPPFHPEEYIRRADSPDEYALRVARRADLTRNYPEQAPAWMPRGNR